MKVRSLLWEIILQNTFYGFGTGALLGAAYAAIAVAIDSIATASPSTQLNLLPMLGGLLYIILIAATIGFFVGAILGPTAGAINGIVTGILTILIFFPSLCLPSWSYLIIMRVIAVPMTIVSSLLIGPVFLHFLFPFGSTDSHAFWVWNVFIPALIAGCAAFWSTGRIARWFLHQSQSTSQETAHLS